MTASQSLRLLLIAGSLALLFSLVHFSAGASPQGGGFTIFGRVYLPDGKPATRVKVYLEMTNGLSRDVLSDDDGDYEFRSIGAGRYRVKAVNPAAPEQYSDPAESDSTRAYANRVHVDVYLRLPLHGKKESGNPGTVNVATASQNIPKPARQAYEQGLKFQKENKADKALASFNQALELYPEYFQALTERGNLLMQHNKLAEALADFDRALLINDKHSPALRGAAYCNLQQRKYEVAVGQLEKSLLYEPKVALSHMLLGYARLSLKRYDEAKLSLGQALKLGGDNIARARVYLAEVFAQEQKFKEAADEIRAYLKSKPDAADAANLRKLEEDWRARGKALLFTPQQPPDAAAKFNRAVELQQQGKLDEAAAEYRAALAIKPDYAEAQANLGAVLSRLGKYDEAIVAYESAYKLAPHLTPILLNLGIAHYRAGQLAKAAETLKSFLEKRPDSMQARQLYGLSLFEIGRDEEAIVELELTLDAAQPDPAVLYSLGLAYLRLGKPGFRATLERLAAFPAGRPALHLLQGQAFLRDLEFELALEELQAAAKLHPDLPRLHLSLGLAHFKLGHNKEAIAAFEEELKRSARDFTTLYYLADALEKDGDISAAQQRIEAALKLDPQAPEAQGLLGKILFKRGKAAEAAAPLEFAAAKKPNDHELRYTLARVYQQLGRKEDAAREFAEVQRLKAEQLKRDRANTPKP